MVELLKQGQYVPMPVSEQVASMWAATKGYLDDVAVNKIASFEQEFLSYMKNRYQKVLTVIAKEKTLSSDSEAQLIKAVGEFKKSFK